MNNFYLPLFLDTIFFLLVGFFLSYPFFNGFINPSLTFLSSFSFAIILSIIGNRILKKKSDKAFLNKKEKKEYSSRLTQINLMSRSELFTFFKEYLVLKRITFNQTRYGFVLVDKKVFLFFKFNYEKVEKVDIVRYFNLLDDDYSALVISSSFDEEVSSFSKRFNGKIRLLPFNELYLDLEKLGFFPPEKYILLDENPKFRFNLSAFLRKKNAKNFLVFGILFSVMSFFVPIKIYYLLWGGFFLISALVTKLYGREDPPKRSAI